MSTLTKANSQWANRAADERFSSLDALHAKALANRQLAATAKVPMNALHVVEHDGAVLLNGSTGAKAHMTNWSFSQLAREAEAPPSYLRTLPARLAVDCLNEGLARNAGDTAPGALLFSHNGHDVATRRPTGLTLRALTSEKYTRIWNSDVTKRLVELEQRGPWQPAPAAFDGSRGLYMGDRDMFAFLVDNGRRIFETDKGGLSRGFFVWNSEVGASSFGLMTFLYEYVCGNHRVWGASNIKELRMRHIGDADQRGFGEFQAQIRAYAESSAADDTAKIVAARAYQLGKTKDEVLDAVFGLRVPQLGRKLIEQGYALAEKREDWYGSPRSAWGLAGGLTEIARDLPNADERVALDRASSRVMEMAF